MSTIYPSEENQWVHCTCSSCILNRVLSVIYLNEGCSKSSGAQTAWWTYRSDWMWTTKLTRSQRGTELETPAALLKLSKGKTTLTRSWPQQALTTHETLLPLHQPLHTTYENSASIKTLAIHLLKLAGCFSRLMSFLHHLPAMRRCSPAFHHLFFYQSCPYPLPLLLAVTSMCFIMVVTQPCK